jgi:hypothetical protein
MDDGKKVISNHSLPEIEARLVVGRSWFSYRAREDPIKGENAEAAEMRAKRLISFMMMAFTD